MKRNKVCLSIITLIIFLTACSSIISQEQAIKTAQDFVNSNVRFYVSEETENNNLGNTPEVTIQIIDVIEKEKDWVITLYASSLAFLIPVSISLTTLSSLFFLKLCIDIPIPIVVKNPIIIITINISINVKPKFF